MIARMQKRGLQIDPTHFDRLAIELVRDMEKCEARIQELTGYRINPGSGDQVANLLFKKMGIRQAKPRMTVSGDRESVEDEVLKAIQHEHPVVSVIQDYHEFDKLRGTYVLPIPKLARRTAFGQWRLFPNFRTTRVPSGRLAAAAPNLLAMPTRTERGKDIRRGFITDSGWKYLSVDLSQIEVRVAAQRSQDTNLCNVYRNRQDVYSDFATSAFLLPDKRYQDKDSHKWKYPTVDKDVHRFPAKTCVLASIYDVTAIGLQEQMPVVCRTCNKPSVCPKCRAHKEHDTCVAHDCSNFVPLWVEDKCQTLINAFYFRYPNLMRMRLDDHNFMRHFAYIVDDWGRLQHITAVRSVLRWVAHGALREGSNTPVQGTAQGIIKLAMAQVEDLLGQMGLYSSELVYPLLSIHDELLFELREDLVEGVGQLVRECLVESVRLDIPLDAEEVSADTWGSLPK